MGYYTLHRIRIINEYNTQENLEELKDIIEKISEYSFHLNDGVITDYLDEEKDMGRKWYDCNKDMRAVSRFVPDFLIQVKGKGEEDEIWEFTFQNGLEIEKYCTSFSDDENEEDEGNNEINENILNDNEQSNIEIVEQKLMSDEINRR